MRTMEKPYTNAYLYLKIKRGRNWKRSGKEPNYGLVAIRSSRVSEMALQLQIEKLKGLDNYKAWSMTVRAYLESEELWSVVENGPENNEESLLKDKRAKFLILCLIETKLCQFMVSIRTSKDLWTYLRTQHSLR